VAHERHFLGRAARFEEQTGDSGEQRSGANWRHVFWHLARPLALLHRRLERPRLQLDDLNAPEIIYKKFSSFLEFSSLFHILTSVLQKSFILYFIFLHLFTYQLREKNTSSVQNIHLTRDGKKIISLFI
jgi:hypothetical protein